MVSRNDLVIQGKSSCLPAYLLFKPILLKSLSSSNFNQFDVIDACAAPGNKTIQLSDYMRHIQGKVFAFEKDQKRFKVLESRMQQYQTINVECFNLDFLSSNPHDQKFSHVRYILLDPSCSGSGMLNQIFFQSESNDKVQQSFQTYCQNQFQLLEEEQKEKVKMLQNFQLKILNHAMKFPSVKKIVYSTCSLYEEENEKVVQGVLMQNNQFKLVNPQKKWKIQRGFGGFEKCIRTNPLSQNIDGFFVAVFVRKSNNKQ